MGDRGSDSAGVAVYGDPTWSPPGRGCVSVLEVDADAPTDLGLDVDRDRGDRRHVSRSPADASSEALLAAVRAAYPQALIAGFGADLAVLKGVGHPRDADRRVGPGQGAGLAGCRPHPDGHRVGGDARRAATRTPSGPNSAWCTTARSPTTPPSAANCSAAGVRFDSENDTEVGARFVAKQLADGRDVETALKELCATFDGFYTLLVSNRDSFAVVRDAIACKPAVIAETDDWVAMASEYRALAGLPGVENAAIWEPEPEVVYAWTQMTATVTASTCATTPLREVNAALHHPDLSGEFVIDTPAGAHNVAVGVDAPVKVTVDGHVGYYAAGMNQQAEITINGNAGTGVAENMMSGTVWVKGNASQSAGATAHGGLLVIEGNAAARCGISMKGVDIVVGGNVGHMSAFMAQAGRLVVRGDAGEALGDSIYEARIYVRGDVASLGADCVAKEMRPEHHEELGRAAEGGGFRGRRHRRVHPLRLGAQPLPLPRRQRCELLMTYTTDDTGPPGPARVRHLRPAHHRRHPAGRRDRHLRHPRLGRQAAAAALRRPAVPRRVDVALPAGGLPREVRHRRGARRPARQTPTAPGYPGHHRRHVLRRAVRARPRRRWAAAPARSARRPPPVTAA